MSSGWYPLDRHIPGDGDDMDMQGIETGMEEYQELADKAIQRVTVGQNFIPVVGGDLVAALSAEEAARVLLEQTTGLDATSPHGAATPARFVAMLRELTTPEEFTFTTFDNTDHVDEMVIIKDIPFVSLCNHHIVPFIGTASVGYVPGNSLAGLSKFARVVRYYAKGLQVQERLTQQVTDYLEDALQPRGVIVTMRATHMCMQIRGVQAIGAETVTTAVKGVFADHKRTAKQEFLQSINGGH